MAENERTLPYGRTIPNVDEVVDVVVDLKSLGAHKWGQDEGSSNGIV